MAKFTGHRLPPIKDLETYEDILIVLAGHYLIKARLMGMTEQDVCDDLHIEIANFDVDSVTDVAISILRPSNKLKLN